MLKQYLEFLTKLKNNNNRQWFAANKAEYASLQADYMVWIEKILFEMVEIDSSLQFLSAKECVFRINRDIRFTNDKSPYKTNLSGIFSSSGKSGHNCGYYFEISSDGELMVGGGQYYLFPKDLFRVRKMLAKDASPLRKVLGNKDFKATFGELNGEKLKTHPKGFSPEDPNLDLLKFKNYIAMAYLSAAERSDDEIAEIIVSKFKTVKPLVDLIRKW